MKMVLAQLGGSVWRALQQMSNATIIDEKGLNECLNEITRALLQADVQFKLVRDMQSNIKKTVNLDDLAAGHNKRFPRKKFGTLIRCSRFSVREVAAEVCEELFTPIPLHAELALNGVEVFMNASGSHHQLRKLDLRLRDFIGATHSRGGVYMYSNHQGCDGGRLYYDGCSCVVVNGDVVAQGSQFSLKDVEVVVAQIDLDAVLQVFYISISSLHTAWKQL